MTVNITSEKTYAYSGKCWQYAEAVAFVAAGTVGLYTMGARATLLEKAGYSAVSFLFGKAAYYGAKEAVETSSLKNKKVAYIGKADIAICTALAIITSIFVGGCCFSLRDWGLRKACVLTMGSYIPAVILREEILRLWSQNSGVIQKRS